MNPPKNGPIASYFRYFYFGRAGSPWCQISSNRYSFSGNWNKVKFGRGVKIWIKEIDLTLDDKEQLAFEGSTALYLSDSMHLNKNGYDSSNFELKVEIISQGEGYLVCDFEITIDGESTFSPIKVQKNVY